MGPIVLICTAGALLLSFVLTLIVRAVSWRIGFIDRPGGHKEHSTPVALGGGVAIFLTLLLPTFGGVLTARWLLASGNTEVVPEYLQPHLSGISEQAKLLAAILGGALALHVIGLIDDVKPLGPGAKFAGQTIVALAISGLCGVRAAEALGPVPAVILTTLWIVLIVNAFNFLDNMDGLAAGVAAIAAGIFAIAAVGSGQVFVPLLACVLVGALLGFLVFNFPPASVFMGDAGSMVVGYMLAVLTVMTTYFDPDQGFRPIALAVPIVVLAVPLYDVVSVVLIRLRAGDSPFRGDRRHFSHRLVSRGMSVRAAVMTIYLATAATGLGAILLPRADWVTAAIVIAQAFFVVLIIAILEHSPSRKNAAPK